MMRILLITTTLVLTWGLFSCENSTAGPVESTSDVAVLDTVQVDTVAIVEPEPEPIKITYALIATKDTLHWLDSLPPNILKNILIVNRLDKKYLARQDSIIIPDSLIEDLDVYCPFPKTIDSIKHINKMIYVSRYAQAFVAYENGERVKWGPVSTGKSTTQTPAGLYSTNWKSKRNISSVNSSWILNWYFNIHNFEGIAFHEYALPGIAASHGCVRMYGADANWMYGWANQWIMDANQIVLAKGTAVIIYGQYPYNERKPWWQLAEDGQVMHFSQGQMMDATRADLETIEERQNVYLHEIEKRELKKLELDSLVIDIADTIVI